jgi:nucleotide-binding universal stress UspA family protein
MFKSILVPIDLTDTDLAKPAIATAATLSQTWSGMVRLLNVLPMTPVMLAEYVPAILEEAAAVHADLIVMTSHRPAMRTYFLGSNAGHVVRYAKCSVLVVRH